MPGRGGPGAGVGERAADLLSALNISESGHLEHMPGHLYLRIGRFADAVVANERAHAADALYSRSGLSPYGPCHNLYFGVYAASMAGMRSKAYKMSSEMREIYRSDPNHGDAPATEMGWNAPLTARVRFGDWEEILADNDTVPSPGSRPYAVLLRHYSTGIARLHRGSKSAAIAELDALRALVPRVSASFASLARVANLTLTAAVALSSSSSSSAVKALRAVSLLREAADEQMSWHYNEPPSWHIPMTQCLGLAQLKASLFDDAVSTFETDLSIYPENAYGLTGLKLALEARGAAGDDARAKDAQRRLTQAWASADVPLPKSSCTALDL